MKLKVPKYQKWYWAGPGSIFHFLSDPAVNVGESKIVVK